MSKFRKFLIIFFTINIISIEIYSVLTDREIFPFAPMTMYSYLHKPERVSIYFIYFRKDEGEFFEATGEYLAPFDEAKLKTSISHTNIDNIASKEDHQDKLYEKAKSIFKNYKRSCLRKQIENCTYNQVHVILKKWNNMDALRTSKPTSEKSIVIYKE